MHSSTQVHREALQVRFYRRFKGQLISKGLLVSSILPKKQTKKFDFTTTSTIPQVDLFSFFFWENQIEDTQKTFRN